MDQIGLAYPSWVSNPETLPRPATQQMNSVHTLLREERAKAGGSSSTKAKLKGSSQGVHVNLRNADPESHNGNGNKKGLLPHCIPPPIRKRALSEGVPATNSLIS